MRGYISYFKTVLLTNLQYKIAALAGLCTQFFWGFLQIFIYEAFYEGVGDNAPIVYGDLVDYVWLQQAFFALIYIRHRDDELANSIKNGQIAYELVRPYNLYFWWYIKCIAKKYASVALRFFPIIFTALLLPEPYNLSSPDSLVAFLLFLLALVLGSLVLTGIIVILQNIMFFTLEDKGINSVINTIAELLAGLILPIPLLPDVLKAIASALPFRLIGDLSFRIYSGNIPIKEATINILFQLLWICILVIVGYLLTKKSTKKLQIQGG
ncbi:MAG: ABC-2 family transporter protein [Clostridia bacterium]|nr:ABC-2 family transporter protein [Clostridia bacterium]